MKVTFPFSEPAGFQTDKVFKIINYPASGIVSASGNAYINRGTLLFKFYNFSEDVRLVIDLANSGRIGPLAHAETDVKRGAGARLVLFEEFPPEYLRNNVYCYFELRLTVVPPNRRDTATAVDVQMLYRP
jgi:hypothetical protein